MPLTAVLLVALLAVQSASDALVAALRPALPYPAANVSGDLPSDNSPTSRWFVVWPAQGDDPRVIVRANPLHPEVQKISAVAMEDINAAVTAAERRAQAAYDRALEQLRKTGKSTELEPVTLDDEGIAGERIDAELEVVIERLPIQPFEVTSGEPPSVEAGSSGVAWMVTVPANTYRLSSGSDRREHFRAAEIRLYLDLATRPTVNRLGDEPRYRVNITPSPGGVSVLIRGQAALVRDIATTGQWSLLTPR